MVWNFLFQLLAKQRISRNSPIDCREQNETNIQSPYHAVRNAVDIVGVRVCIFESSNEPETLGGCVEIIALK